MDQTTNMDQTMNTDQTMDMDQTMDIDQTMNIDQTANMDQTANTANTSSVNWDDLNAGRVLGNPLAGLSLGGASSSSPSNSGPGLPPIDPNTISLDQLPSELLVQILNKLNVQDRIATAFDRPNDFMNVNRYHLFVDDANRQLQIPTYPVPETGNAEQVQRPLVLEAIAHGFSVYQIAQMLDIYEEVCEAHQVNSHTFLNSDFPSNRPAYVPPPGPESSHIARNVQSPLHVAVHHRRLDVVKYLIQRGANPSQITRYPNQTPFQYALTLVSRWWRYFEEHDAERNRQLEDIALELEPDSGSTPYTRDLQDITLELYQALSGGLARLVLVMLRTTMYRGLLLTDAQIGLIQDRQTEILNEVLVAYPPMPTVLAFLLGRGTVYDEGIFLEAARAGRMDLAITTLTWVSRNGVRNYRSASRDIGRLAHSDENLPLVQRFVGLLRDMGHNTTITSILGQAIYATPDSPETKKWLLDNTNTPNDVILRHAIALRDMGTTALMAQRIIAAGQTIDSVLDIGSGLYAQGNWSDTPLTFALAQENYHAASQLISLGADPGLVPANIRHRVRRNRDRVFAYQSQLQNPSLVDALFRGRQDCQDGGVAPTLEMVVNAVNYVLARMLDDTRYPLPEYHRPSLRNEDVDEDHRDNDSEFVDFVAAYDIL
ncbi:hypothetical protein ANO14919_036470 [Xylariales sp. No.14919]|nr:hypothetical protein ANO14919_036470 [Xylariales sp. No.14919]